MEAFDATHLAAVPLDEAFAPPRPLVKLTPGVPSDGHYEELAAVFRPVFDRIAEGASGRDASRTLPFEQVGWLNTVRFGALRVPAEHGGYGASLVDAFRLLIELAQADSQVAHLLRSHIGFVEALHLSGDAQLRSKWFDRLASGHLVGNAYTERGGNGLGSLNTRLSQREGRWRVTGQKYYCTGTIFSDWVAVAAAHPETPGRHIALVNTGHSGVRILDDWDGFGQQLTGTGSTSFEDVPVDTLLSPDQLAPHPEAAVFQVVLLAVQAGICRAALADARNAVQARTRAFSTGTGVPARREPQVLQLVGELSATAFAVDSIVVSAAAEIQAALAAGDLSVAERHAVCALSADRAQTAVQPLVLAAASKLFDGLGASSTSRSCNLDRHWRNARTIATHNPALYKARIVGDYEVNGTEPAVLNSVGDVPAAVP